MFACVCVCVLAWFQNVKKLGCGDFALQNAGCSMHLHVVEHVDFPTWIYPTANPTMLCNVLCYIVRHVGWCWLLVDGAKTVGMRYGVILTSCAYLNPTLPS